MSGTFLQAAEALMRRLDNEPSHALAVRRVAESLFDATRPLHGLGEGERDLLTAAAMLHDIGWSVGASSHHKHSRDLILQNGVPGLDARGLALVACVARYHRKAFPAPSHAVYCDLTREDRSLVRKLAALLRIADGLDRSHRGVTLAVEADIGPERVTLTALQAFDNPFDISGAMAKRDLFEEVYTLPLVIVGRVSDTPV
jgi:exopolyphosphatase / guanosine-5'-triphosphate,3'-diphosphate pyrophosphatase